MDCINVSGRTVVTTNCMGPKITRKHINLNRIDGNLNDFITSIYTSHQYTVIIDNDFRKPKDPNEVKFDLNIVEVGDDDVSLLLRTIEPGIVKPPEDIKKGILFDRERVRYILYNLFHTGIDVIKDMISAEIEPLDKKLTNIQILIMNDQYCDDKYHIYRFDSATLEMIADLCSDIIFWIPDGACESVTITTCSDDINTY